MQLLLACLSLAVAALAASRPTGDEIRGKPTPLNPADLVGTSWELMPQINRNTKESFYWVPVEVGNPETQFSQGNKITMNITVGESTCQKGTLQVYEINPTSCPLKEGGKRAVFFVNIWERIQNKYVKIETTKIQGDEEEKRLPGVIYGDKH